MAFRLVFADLGWGADLILVALGWSGLLRAPPGLCSGRVLGSSGRGRAKAALGGSGLRATGLLGAGRRRRGVRRRGAARFFPPRYYFLFPVFFPRNRERWGPR